MNLTQLLTMTHLEVGTEIEIMFFKLLKSRLKDVMFISLLESNALVYSI